MKWENSVGVAVAMALWVSPTAAQTPGAAVSDPEPSTMSRSDLEREVTSLRNMLTRGAVRPSRPAGCTEAAHRQLDFWLGEWDVSPERVAELVVAESSITLMDQGCVVFEEWRPLVGAHGRSTNIFDVNDQHWHQTWVSAAGRRTEYRGQFEDGAMRYNDVTEPANGRFRMTLQQVDANTVRQWSERFDEATNNWLHLGGLIYRRRVGSAVTAPIRSPQ